MILEFFVHLRVDDFYKNHLLTQFFAKKISSGIAVRPRQKPIFSDFFPIFSDFFAKKIEKKSQKKSMKNLNFYEFQNRKKCEF